MLFPITVHETMETHFCTVEGLFESDSVLQKLSLESARLLGGGRALLLQLAHPLIAAAVAEHSCFQAHPLRRLGNTLEMTRGIIHGDGRVAGTALREFHARHAHVQGFLPHSVGPFSAGTAYAGNDPELKMWVHSTVIDTMLVTYERFVALLTPADRRRFYEDAKLLASYYSIPDNLIPPTLEQFNQYMQTMFDSETLTVSDTARVLAAAAVMDPKVSSFARGFARVVRFVSAGMLPERIRSAYGLVWDARRQAILDSLSRASRVAVPILPIWIRHTSRSGKGSLVRWMTERDKIPFVQPDKL